MIISSDTENVTRLIFAHLWRVLCKNLSAFHGLDSLRAVSPVTPLGWLWKAHKKQSISGSHTHADSRGCHGSPAWMEERFNGVRSPRSKALIGGCGRGSGRSGRGSECDQRGERDVCLYTENDRWAANQRDFFRGKYLFSSHFCKLQTKTFFIIKADGIIYNVHPARGQQL